MSIHFHGKYQAGVIRPDEPLALAEGSEIELVVTAVSQVANGHRRPVAPKFTAAELAENLRRHAVSVGSLPGDFSRADIYYDHD